MDGRLLAQLACVAQRDSDAIYDSYAWPPRAPLTPEERAEAERLRVVASRLFYRAAEEGWGTAGMDEIFGGGSERLEDADQVPDGARVSGDLGD
jgi:hypothetical protein